MTREEFIKQRCEIDKITEEEFKKQYRVVKCDCGQPYCKGYRCLDLDDLLKENKKLKDNWNKLKEFTVKEYYMYLPLEANTKSITILIDKMNELESGDLDEK